jgi:hypothetical protein
LEGVASEPPRGARGAQAGLAALQALKKLDEPLDEQSEKVQRLFDHRPDDERVAADEWHASSDPAFARLYAHETLGQRRRWYRTWSPTV